MTKHVMDIQDARALKTMGLPFETPVIGAKISSKGKKLCEQAFVLTERFAEEIFSCKSKWPKAIALFRKLDDHMLAMDQYVGALDPTSEEAALFVSLLLYHIQPFVLAWRSIFASEGVKKINIAGPGPEHNFWKCIPTLAE